MWFLKCSRNLPIFDPRELIVIYVSRSPQKPFKTIQKPVKYLYVITMRFALFCYAVKAYFSCRVDPKWRAFTSKSQKELTSVIAVVQPESANSAGPWTPALEAVASGLPSWCMGGG